MADFEQACTAILLKQPFYGSLLMHYKVATSEDIPTAAVSLDTITYNPTWFAGLSQGEGIFVVLHEVIHGALEHVQQGLVYLQAGHGPDGEPYDPALMNVAMDFIVNAMATDTEMGTRLPNALYDPKRFPVTMTAAEVYCKLKEGRKQEKVGAAGSGEETSGEPLDTHDFSKEGKTPAITSARVLSAARHAQAVHGTVPAQFDRYIKDLSKPTVSPWTAIRRSIQATRRGHDATSYKRPNRRLVTRGIVAPGAVSQASGPIAIVVDTSGSIAEKTLNFFGGHMAAILTELRPELVQVIWCDSQVAGVDLVRDMQDLKRVLAAGAKGGGGTDMREGIRAAEDLGVKQIIVLTDLCTPTCDSRIPVLWASTTPQVSTHGQTVHIFE